MAAAAAHAAPGMRALIVGSEQDFPPFAVGMTDETAGGFTVDLWKAVAQEQGLEFQLRVRPFDEILRGFKAGQYDMLINLAKSDERERFADFSVTHVEVGGAIFVRAGDRRLRAESDLAGQSIIVLKGDLAHDYAIGKGWQAQLTLVDTAEQGLRLLASGQHDAMLISKLAGLQTIRKHGIDGVVALDAKVGYSQRFAFAVRKGDAELLARINEGLAVVKARGEYERLHEKWFGVFETRPHDLKHYVLALAPLIAVFAILTAVAYVRRRRREGIAASRLRDSEERWSFALEGAGDGVWDADLKSGSTLYSRRWKEMLGYRDSEIGTDPCEWLDRIHPEDLARVQAENQACLDGHAVEFISEFRMRSKDGRWIWILDRGKVVRRSAEGQALRMIGTHSDISARKMTEERAGAHAKALLAIANDSALDDILASIVAGLESASDWRCRIHFLDAAAEASRPDGAAAGRVLAAGVTAATLPCPEAGACKLVMQSGHRIVCQDVHLAPPRAHPDQAMPACSLGACWSEAIIGSGGVVLGNFAACRQTGGQPSAADIEMFVEAARVAAIAIERARGEQALRDSEERLQRALDASRLALWDFDLESGRVYMSDAWSEMMGGLRVASWTDFDSLCAMVPPDDQTRIAEAMREALRGESQTYKIEHRVRRPDGRLIWILCQGRVVERDPQGRVRRAVGTNRDITERKQAESTRDSLEAQLREAQKLEAIGTLAGGIAHDFNNIIAAILGNLAFVRQDLDAGHPAQTYLDQINKAGLRARDLVQQVLAFSRKQAHERRIEAVAPLVTETAAMLRSIAGGSVKVRTILPARKVAAMVNPTQLQQVLMNLGTNAIQALPDGGGSIEIGLECVDAGTELVGREMLALPGPCVRLWVRDDGCGMDDETRRHIFEPFFTTKPVGQGTGLGLAVAHGIVETHEGLMGVETSPGRGSTFSVYLPLIDYESRPVPLQSEMPARRGSGQHVLYVDDDEVMALMVRGLLERLGYRVTCIHEGHDAVAFVERQDSGIDLVVSDFNMPRMTGLDVAREMARIRPALPVVISSGYVSEELRVSAARLGVRGVMQKEHTLEELGALVHEVISGPRSHRDLEASDLQIA